MTDAELHAMVKQPVAVGRDRTATRRTGMNSGICLVVAAMATHAAGPSGP